MYTCRGRLTVVLGLVLAGCATPSGAPGPAPAPAAAPAAITSVFGAHPVEPLPAPLPHDPMGVTIHQLDNGLTVYISTDREYPRVAVQIVVRAGARHDPGNSTGLAHYLEHMLFKGSARLGTLDGESERVHLAKIEALYDRLFVERDEGKRTALLAAIDQENQAASKFVIPGEVDRIYTSIGARGLNAFTSADATRYVIEVPSNRLEHWARLDAERLLHPTFRLFQSELEAVYEEKNRALDNPERRVYEASVNALFPAHPYGSQLSIGSIEHLKNPAYRQMVEFYRRWYVPNNVAIVLAGDVDAARALPIIRAQFGGWKAQPLPALPPSQLPPVRGRVVREVVAEGEESVSLAWKTIPAVHEDAAVFAVIDLVMGGQGGLLNTELLLGQKVLRASAGRDLDNEAGYWGLRATARKGQSLDELERLLLATLAALKRGQFSDEDLAAIILNAEIADKRAIESTGARADRMADAFVRGEPWARVVGWLERLRKVTKADVLRVADRYLGDDYVLVRRKNGKFAPPKIAKPRITPIKVEPGRKSPFARLLEQVPVTPNQPVWVVEGEHYERGKLPAGKLLSARNQRNDLFSIGYEFEVGTRALPLLCHALSLQVRAGAGELDAAALRKRLHALGASITRSCGPAVVSIGVSGIDRNMEATLALLDDWFRRPRFDDADIGKLLTTTLSERKIALDDPRINADALANYALVGTESAYLLQPSNRQLAGARGSDLARLLARLPDYQHETHYFGPRSAADAAKVIRFGAGRPMRVTRRPPLRYRRAARDVIYFLPRETAQAQVVMALPGPAPGKRERARSFLLDEYLSGGFHGAVSIDIREARGLAYTATAFVSRGARPDDQSALTGYLATQPDKTDQALARLVEILRRQPVDTDRVQNSKGALEENYRASRPSPRGVTYQVDRWDELGYRRDPRPEIRREIAALTPTDLQAYLARLARVPALTSVTGDRARLALPELAKLGRIEEVPVARLFSYGAFPSDAPAVAKR